MKPVIGLILLVSCHSPLNTENGLDGEEAILSSLRSIREGRGAEVDNTVKVNTAFVDLNGDNTKEVIAYVHGDNACGSGGCDLLILNKNNKEYELLTELTISWPPIRVLDSKTNGWRDIAVWVQGGGIQPGYEARLRFDGKSYPSNPSLVAPEEGMPAKGKIVIDRSSPATPLYK